MLNDICNFLLSNLTKMTYLTKCQIEHLVKMHFKMNISIKMTFDFVKNDKGYLYYLNTLLVWLVKIAFSLIKSDKAYLCYVSTLKVLLVKMAFGLVPNIYIYIYKLCAPGFILGKLNIYNVNNVCFIILV